MNAPEIVNAQKTSLNWMNKYSAKSEAHGYMLFKPGGSESYNKMGF
jgi:hypothetical protein